ncbi:hypothetical protein LBMAG37_12870 [Anaerolineae bacterium]|nr:hypothetical protein EMGBS3_05320 [Anaerolineaceae bacterium]GBL38368.1 hypothetical protein EMGBD1_20550 [Anaerolineaceae bacterium]GDX68132.1 hypothetical protein LBMAG37_12870 [Anaerolineae bacterium]
MNAEPQIELRAAQPRDMRRIRAIIRRARINRLGLRWRRFTVAVANSKIIGCVQLKVHRDGTVELASLAVERDWRGRAIGAQLVADCIARHPAALHLMCTHKLVAYYLRLGFAVVALPDLPPYFKRLMRVLALVAPRAIKRGRIVVMARGT